jgi:hypothetical protein
MLLLLLVALTGCDEWPTYPDNGTIFVVEVVPGERFRILLNDPARIETARALLASGQTTVVHGELARGNGRFNIAYGWHLRPSTVTFVDVAMELCDGRPSFVQQELDYFMAKVKYYCPWGARIVAER